MRLPWTRRPEVRQADYTAQLVALLQAAATGADASATNAAATEIAAGLWSRAFASAQVEPAHLRSSITPGLLSMAARALVVRGEAVFAIGPGLQLLPAQTWDVTGGPDPDGWRYRLDLAGPDRTESRSLLAAQVVHLRYSCDLARPWRGVGPLARAASTAQLVGQMETRLSDEAAARSAYLLPIPTGGEEDSVSELKADLAGARGSVQLVETQTGGWGEGQIAAPRMEWTQKRIGFDAPSEARELREDAALDLLAACGIPPSLALAAIDGTAQRESWRRFLHSTIAPVGELAAAELSEKLGAAVSLGFDRLFASDVQGRARAAASLAAAGVSIDEALARAGFD